LHLQPPVQTKSETVTFVVPGEPVPQPRARVSTRGGFARAYVPRQHPVHAYREGIAVTAKAAGSTITKEAVSVTILALFARPKSHLNKSGLKKTAPLCRVKMSTTLPRPCWTLSLAWRGMTINKSQVCRS